MIDHLVTTEDKERENLTTISSIKHKNRLAFNHRPYQENNYLLNKLFFSSSSIQTNQASIYEKETEREREMRLIENLNFNKKRLNKEYQDKLNDLLQIKKDPDYATMRKNMDQLIYKTDRNSNVYLTLPKCLKKTRVKYRDESTQIGNNTINHNNRKNIKTETDEKQHPTLSLREKEQKASHKRDILTLIPEFNRVNNDMINHRDLGNQLEADLSDRTDMLCHLNEEEQKELLDKLRTKNNFNPNDLVQVTRARGRDEALTLGNITKNSNSKSQDKNKDKMEINQMHEVFERYITKAKLIKSVRMNKTKKMHYGLEGVDLFYYNSKRWDQSYKSKILKVQKEELMNKREETKRTLKLMINGYEQLNDMIKKIKGYDNTNAPHDVSPSTNKKRKHNETFIRNNMFITSPNLYRYT